jgi:hypothetical protein
MVKLFSAYGSNDVGSVDILVFFTLTTASVCVSFTNTTNTVLLGGFFKTSGENMPNPFIVSTAL